VNAVMYLRVPLNAGKLSSSYTIGGLSSSSQFHRVSWLLIEVRLWLFLYFWPNARIVSWKRKMPLLYNA
jgi:hypothetical protein